MRQKPQDGDEFAWDMFQEYADKVRLGTHEENWLFNWEMWKVAYTIGNDEGYSQGRIDARNAEGGFSS